MPPRWRARLWRQVGGNPAFVLESVKLVARPRRRLGARRGRDAAGARHRRRDRAPHRPAQPAGAPPGAARRDRRRQLQRAARRRGAGVRAAGAERAAARARAAPGAVRPPVRARRHRRRGAQRRSPQSVAEFMHRFVAEYLGRPGRRAGARSPRTGRPAASAARRRGLPQRRRGRRRRVAAGRAEPAARRRRRLLRARRRDRRCCSMPLEARQAVALAPDCIGRAPVLHDAHGGARPHRGAAPARARCTGTAGTPTSRTPTRSASAWTAMRARSALGLHRDRLRFAASPPGAWRCAATRARRCDARGATPLGDGRRPSRWCRPNSTTRMAGGARLRRPARRGDRRRRARPSSSCASTEHWIAPAAVAQQRRPAACTGAASSPRPRRCCARPRAARSHARPRQRPGDRPATSRRCCASCGEYADAERMFERSASPSCARRADADGDMRTDSRDRREPPGPALARRSAGPTRALDALAQRRRRPRAALPRPARRLAAARGAHAEPRRAPRWSPRPRRWSARSTRRSIAA